MRGIMRKANKIIIILTAILTLLIGYYAVNRITITREKSSLKESIVKNNTLPELENSQAAVKFTGERTLYILDLLLNTDNNSLSGHETVKFMNKHNSALKDLVLHLYPDSYNSAETMPTIGGNTRKLTDAELGDIKINSFKVNGTSLQYTEDNQILKTKLDKEIKPGETVQLDIDFTLKIPFGKDRLAYYNDQYSLTNWYPILSVYDEKTSSWDENPFHPVGESNYSESSDYITNITVPKNTVVVTTGVKLSKETSGDTDKITFEASNNRDFVLFICKDYKVLSKEVDGIRVNSYYLKEETTAKRMLDLASESLKFFNSAFGKYPNPEYDVVETSLQGGAMEYPTVTQMGPYGHLAPEYKENNLTFFDEAVVHETAHQWWYSTVGNNEFLEPILDESFTAYSTALFFEKLYGEYSSKAVKAAFLSAPISGGTPIYRSTDKFTWRDFSTVVYRLGPVVLEDLRQRVGKENFIDIFRTYYDRYKYKNATFEGFLEIVKEKAGAEVSNYVRSAFTSSNYTMEKLLLTPEEVKKIQQQRLK
jgi:aminopeptidase N